MAIDPVAAAEADRLRARAAELRHVAAVAAGTPVQEAAAAGGTLTWQGPVADAFADACRRATRLVEAAAGELLAAAAALERRADEWAP
jgi:hypothetical protein